LQETSLDKNLIDHPSLIILLPHMHSYCEKGLTRFSEGKDSFSVTTIETYTCGVFERVAELDSALISLRLACKFIAELGLEQNPSPEVYRYHYENFVLRVIGLVDRAHRLVGASLLLPSNKYEVVGGNSFVQRTIKTSHPGLNRALDAVADAVNSYRGPRNELIHSSAYSSRELGIFMGVEQFAVDTGTVNITELKRDYSSAGAVEIGQTIGRLILTLTELLEELGPVFSTAQKFSILKRDKTNT